MAVNLGSGHAENVELIRDAIRKGSVSVYDIDTELDMHMIGFFNCYLCGDRIIPTNREPVKEIVYSPSENRRERYYAHSRCYGRARLMLVQGGAGSVE